MGDLAFSFMDVNKFIDEMFDVITPSIPPSL